MEEDEEIVMHEVEVAEEIFDDVSDEIEVNIDE